MLLAAIRRLSSSFLRSSPTMLATSTRPAPNAGLNGKQAPHTVTALKRWSCDDKDLPAAADVKSIHVYDFDNTLFASPLPNKQIWNGVTVGQLASPDMFVNGGWWHDSSILAATGEGAEKEEARAWQGWWNEQIVALVELSMQQKDALNVLLTGRSEQGFADLIKRMVRSKKLDFHMVCLKPSVGPAGQKFRSTMHFKQELLKEIVYTYKEAEEIRIYEDRVKHTKGFREFFFQFNKDLMAMSILQARKTLVAEVVQVAENATQLEPVTEIAQIQRIINSHNLQVKAGNTPTGMPPYQIKKTVFFTGYMISSDTTEKLVELAKRHLNGPDGDIRYHANSILITPKPCPKDILNKVGGIGHKVTWKVIGIASYENKLWAAQVEPVPRSTKIYTENPTPTVVLALRKGARPAEAARISNWQPVSEADSYIFESVVGEKMMLRIEEEHANESRWEMQFANKSNQRRAQHDDEDSGFSRESRPQNQRGHDDRRQNGSNYRGGNQNRGRGGNRNPSYGARGGRGGGHRGDRGGGRGRGRGGGQSQYRSLDDVDKSYGQPNYDDADRYY